MLGSNNYLGLTTHPKVREAAIEAIRKYGTSMTGSRLVNGSMKLHNELEEKLAAFHGKESALVWEQITMRETKSRRLAKELAAAMEQDRHAQTPRPEM